MRSKVDAARNVQLRQDEYLKLDATAMANAVKRGEIEASDLLAAAIERCDAVNPKINAVVMRHDDRAADFLAARQDRGQERTGLLAGVPMLIKDLNTYVSGTATSNGCSFFENAPMAHRSSTLVERYEAAGMTVFGKTASPEFGLTATTESRLWGRTANPWKLTASAGGSSGGAAAAVAAGIIPAAHATDGGGSIRIPASFCGLFGMKPTRYRIPQGPDQFEGWLGASASHVVSRSVRDSALIMDASHGREKGSPYWTAPQDRPFVEEVERDPASLRVAIIADSMTGMPVAPDILRVLDSSIKLLLSLGHEVTSIQLPLDPQKLFGAHGAATGTALVKAIRDREQVLGRAVDEGDLEPISYQLFRNAQTIDGERLYRARLTFESVSRQMEDICERYDVILSPVTATLAAPLGELSLDRPYEDYVNGMMGCASFTVVANVSGQPAMSVPLGWSEAGMPIGMMFTAGLGREGLLFQLAGQLERVKPWGSRYPSP